MARPVPPGRFQEQSWKSKSRLALWVQDVPANLDEFDLAERRLALTELGATVRVWATDHTPRREVKLRPDAFSAPYCASSHTSL
jgi:hypothetical protein